MITPKHHSFRQCKKNLREKELNYNHSRDALKHKMMFTDEKAVWHRFTKSILYSKPWNSCIGSVPWNSDRAKNIHSHDSFSHMQNKKYTPVTFEHIAVSPGYKSYFSCCCFFGQICLANLSVQFSKCARTFLPIFSLFNSFPILCTLV